MPRKKDSSKASETRYTASPSKTEEPKAKKAAAVEVKDAKAITPEAAALIAALRNSDADIARDAATALGTLGEASAVEPLIQVLGNLDGYYHSVVRSAAAASLGRLGDRRAVDVLLGTISDSLAEPSAEAIRALAAIGDPRAVNPLIEVVRNSNGYFLPIARRAAVAALGKFQSDRLVAAELLAVSTNTSEDSVIRQAAVEAIAPTAKKSRG